MSTENVDVSDGRNRNMIILAVTIVVLAIILMYFWDRQQKRALELERLEAQTEVWQEWGVPQQNRRLGNTTGKGSGKIL